MSPGIQNPYSFFLFFFFFFYTVWSVNDGLYGNLRKLATEVSRRFPEGFW